MPHKLIYLARRNPAIAPEDFGEAWRSHSRLASTLGPQFGKHFTRVRQCIKVYDADVPPEYINEHDGTALLTMKSWDDLRAARGHPDALATMRNDELRVFAEYAANFTMAAQEVSAEGSGDGTAALISFVRRKPDVTQDMFDAAWQARAATLVDSDPACDVRSAVLNRVIESPGPRYEFEAVSESWFADVDSALKAAWDPARRESMRELEAVANMPDSVSLLVRINFEKIPVS
jgi:hypothetical protein